MLSRIIPDASLNSDSSFRKELSRSGIIRSWETASLAVASVGVLIAARTNANGRLTIPVAAKPNPAAIAQSSAIQTVSEIITLKFLATL